MSANQITYAGTEPCLDVAYSMACHTKSGGLWDNFVEMVEERHKLDLHKLDEEEVENLLKSFWDAIVFARNEMWEAIGWMEDAYLQVIYTFADGQKMINYMKCKIPPNTTEDEFCAWLEEEGRKLEGKDLGKWVKASCCIYGHGSKKACWGEVVCPTSPFHKLFMQNSGKFFPDCRVVAKADLPATHPLSPDFARRDEVMTTRKFSDEEEVMLKNTYPTHDGEKTHCRVDTGVIKLYKTHRPNEYRESAVEGERRHLDL